MLLRRILLLLFATVGLLTPAISQANTARGSVGKVPLQNGLKDADWKQGKSSSKQCIDAKRIGGAIVVSNRIVDLAMRGGTRWRLFLDRDCSQLSYYGGFYWQAGDDGRICAKKDRIMLRSGGSCRIDKMAPLQKSRTN